MPINVAHLDAFLDPLASKLFKIGNQQKIINDFLIKLEIIKKCSARTT